MISSVQRSPTSSSVRASPRVSFMKRPSGRARDERRGWAVVTGASSGLGREFALALVERGHPVVAVARRGQRLTALAGEVHARGGKLEPLVADLSTVAGVETLLEKAAAIDVELLVNNAGVASYGRFASLPPEPELVRLNVEAIVSLTRGLLPAMLGRGHGGVINVASQMACQPMPYFASYAASKAFVLSFSEALAEELRGKGVRVTAVAPGSSVPSSPTSPAARTLSAVSASAAAARGRIGPTRARARSHHQGRRRPLRLPHPRRPLRTQVRPAPDDGPRDAAHHDAPSEPSGDPADLSGTTR